MLLFESCAVYALMTIVFHERYLDHMQYRGHPERPERLMTVVRKMIDLDLWKDVLKPEAATESDLLLVHTKDHVETIRNADEGFLDPDTYIRNETFEIALLAAGGAIAAANYAFFHRKPVLALLRPPGHHAGKNFCGGFCYFNNVAIAAKRLSLNRLAIVDLDVHHGNGTENVFYADRSVLFISLHQYGIYPCSGAAEDVGVGEGEGFNINIPLGSGSGDGTYFYAFEKIVQPLMLQFKPEALLVSLGIDAHHEDPLASMKLSSYGYVELCRRLIQISPDSRIAFMLEGGYDLEATADVLSALVAQFQVKKIPLRHEQMTDLEIVGKRFVDNVVNVQRKYWDL